MTRSVSDYDFLLLEDPQGSKSYGDRKAKIYKNAKVIKDKETAVDLYTDDFQSELIEKAPTEEFESEEYAVVGDRRYTDDFLGRVERHWRKFDLISGDQEEIDEMIDSMTRESNVENVIAGIKIPKSEVI